MKYSVAVRHPETLEAVVLKAGEPVPEWASGLVQADDLDSPTEQPEEPDGAPSRSAKKDDWLAYAAQQGVEVPEGATKEDIIAAVEAAQSK